MKKNILLVATLVVIMASFVACKNEEPVASEPASSSEVASEEVSSEEVSEEASSEEVASDFSADAIMKLVDELVVKYPYNNPEHIKTLVIAANLEYITAENLDTLLTAYGYSMDDLAVLYDESMNDSKSAFNATISHYEGMSDYENLLDEQTYEKRVKLQDVIIDDETSKLASTYDEMLIQYSLGKADGYEKMVEFLTFIIETTDEFKGIENFIYGYATMTLGDTEIYEQHFINPFVDYQNAN